jgi:hypothetical protein
MALLTATAKQLDDLIEEFNGFAELLLVLLRSSGIPYLELAGRPFSIDSANAWTMSALGSLPNRSLARDQLRQRASIVW